SFNHSNIDFPRRRWRWLARVFTSPNCHAVHHTPDRDRMNYGVALMIWDRIFGTFELPEARPTVFGLHDRAWGRAGVLWQHLEPVRAMLPSPRPRVSSLPAK
ncbi:MAG TPA: sterol desaturase family protein, partial [Myxococcota bacterium]|nr:sterol desaturase family protein [Myxococcota bacterium]